MNTMFAAMLGGWEIVLILAVVLILFGAKKLPELLKRVKQLEKRLMKEAGLTKQEARQMIRSMSEEFAGATETGFFGGAGWLWNFTQNACNSSRADSSVRPPSSSSRRCASASSARLA